MTTEAVPYVTKPNTSYYYVWKEFNFGKCIDNFDTKQHTLMSARLKMFEYMVEEMQYLGGAGRFPVEGPHPKLQMLEVQMSILLADRSLWTVHFGTSVFKLFRTDLEGRDVQEVPYGTEINR